MASKASKTENKNLPTGDHDRVAMASRLPDGEPHQTPDFEFIGPRDAVEAAAEEQLRQQRVSAADTAMRGVEAGGGGLAEESGSKKDGTINPSDAPQDPSIVKLAEAHEAAAAAGEGQAASEVAEHHKGLGEDAAGMPANPDADGSEK